MIDELRIKAIERIKPEFIFKKFLDSFHEKYCNCGYCQAKKRMDKAYDLYINAVKESTRQYHKREYEWWLKKFNCVKKRIEKKNKKCY